MEYKYEKLDENYRKQYCPLNDYDGKITGTGHCIIGLKAWFDENPAERIRLGYIKHIEHSTKDIEYDHATQYLVNTVKRVDDYTVEDDWKIMNMSPEQMRLAELNVAGDWIDTGNDIVFMG